MSVAYALTFPTEDAETEDGSIIQVPRRDIILPRNAQWMDLSLDWEEIVDAAERLNKANWNPNRNHIKDELPDLAGVAGEWAFAKENNTVVNIRIYRDRGDCGWDFTCRSKFDYTPYDAVDPEKRYTIDVKTSRYFTPHPVNIRCSLNKTKWADYYVLVLVDTHQKRAMLHGVATCDEVRALKKTYKGNKFYGIDANDLMPYDEWVADKYDFLPAEY